MPLRVLVVDDHDFWRRYVSSKIRRVLDSNVIHDVGDGLEAVQAATDLCPDLIVLDVGLPGLNGVAAARLIQKNVPSAKILFLSEHHSPDIAAAAIQAGALGYVVKSEAAFELAAALRRTMDGKLFISPRLFGDSDKTSTVDRVSQAPRVHEVALFAEEAHLERAFARFAEKALKEGSSVLVAVSNPSCAAIERHLRLSGMDVEGAKADGRFVPACIEDILTSLVVNGAIDETRFWDVTAKIVVNAAKASRGAYPRVAACGVCAPTLWKQGMLDAAVQLERLWDTIARIYDVDILCGYAADEPSRDDSLFGEIYNAHSGMHSH